MITAVSHNCINEKEKVVNSVTLEGENREREFHDGVGGDRLGLQFVGAEEKVDIDIALERRKDSPLDIEEGGVGVYLDGDGFCAQTDHPCRCVHELVDDVHADAVLREREADVQRVECRESGDARAAVRTASLRHGVSIKRGRYGRRVISLIVIPPPLVCLEGGISIHVLDRTTLGNGFPQFIFNRLQQYSLESSTQFLITITSVESCCIPSHK